MNYKNLSLNSQLCGVTRLPQRIFEIFVKNNFAFTIVFAANSDLVGMSPQLEDYIQFNSISFAHINIERKWTSLKHRLQSVMFCLRSIIAMTLTSVASITVQKCDI